MENMCSNCKRFIIKDSVTKKYGEGCGYCTFWGDIIFYEKHNCLRFERKVEE